MRSNLFLNMLIIVLLTLYIVLTTCIFVLHKKIHILESKQKQAEKNVFTENRNNAINNISNNTKSSLSNITDGNIHTITKEYEKRIENDAENVDDLFKMGVVYMGQSGQEKKALMCFEKVLAKEPAYHAKKNIDLWILNLQEKIRKQEVLFLKRLIKVLESRIRIETNEKTKQIFVDQLENNKLKLQQLEK